MKTKKVELKPKKTIIHKSISASPAVDISKYFYGNSAKNVAPAKERYKKEIEEILKAETPTELRTVIEPFIIKAPPSFSFEDSESWNNLRFQARSKALELRKKYIGLGINIRPVPMKNETDLTAIYDWCVDCEKAIKIIGIMSANKSDDETNTKEQLWDESNKDYQPISKAIKYAKSQNHKISEPKLSKELTPTGNMRYMRKYSKEGKPYRCKVHFGDFSKYIETLPLIKPIGTQFLDENIEDYLKDKESTQATIKERKGKQCSQGEGLRRLAKEITKQ